MGFFEWIGCLLILWVGAAVGVLLVRFERRRCRQAEGFVALVRYIRLQIDCFSMPVGRILRGCDGKLLIDCGVESDCLTDFCGLLQKTRLYLPEEMCRLLWDFGRRLGESYRADQLRNCDYFLERLTPCCDRLRTELPKRERMMLLLPMAFAAMLVLLLV
ncbi:MAG: stage III sporulation protein AB [Clostridia bacterium]|nr:stage III sporulation protein AB [Clostridia bacterium]